MKPKINRVITNFNNDSIQIIYLEDSSEKVCLLTLDAHQDEIQREAFLHMLERLLQLYKGLLEDGPPNSLP